MNKILLGKKILISGIINKNSIAYGISKILYNEGAELSFTYKNIKYKNRLKNIIKEFNSNRLFLCDMSKEYSIYNMINNLYKLWNNFDGILYSISYTNKNQLKGNYILNINKDVFIKSYIINIYGLIYMLKLSKEMLNNNSSILAITYIGSKRVLPNYNIMGPIKSALESNIKYLSYSISKICKDKYIRINGISPGPIKTLSSYYIHNFKKILYQYKIKTPNNKLSNIIDISNVALFLFSDLSLGINGEIIFVDKGFNIMF